MKNGHFEADPLRPAISSVWLWKIRMPSDPTKIPPPYRETGVAIPLSHCVSCGIADSRYYTPTSFRKPAYRSAKTGLGGGASKKKLASEAYRAIGGVARNSIANRAIAGH